MPMPLDWMDRNACVISWGKTMFPDVSYFAQNQHYVIIKFSDNAIINLQYSYSF